MKNIRVVCVILLKTMRRLVLLFFLILFLVLQYRIWFADNSIIDYFILKLNIKNQQQLNSELHQQNQELLQEVQAIKSSEQKVIEVAREKLGLVGQSETFYRIVPDENKK